MNSLRIRMNLRFEKPIVFDAFFPTEKDPLRFDLPDKYRSIHIHKNDGRYTGLLFVEDPDKQLQENYKALLTAGACVKCNSLTLEILNNHPSTKLIEMIEQGYYTDAFAPFGQELYSIGHYVQFIILDFCRNRHKQIQLKPVRTKSELFDIYLIQWQLRWFNRKQNCWSQLQTTRAVRYLSTVDAAPSNGLVENQWKELRPFLTEGRKTPVQDMLMANSYMHLSDGDTRIAIVEAVMALEAEIKITLPRALSARSNTKRNISNLIKKLGLTSTLEIFLRTWVAEELIDSAKSTINIRNRIIHRQRKHVKEDEAEKLVQNIDEIIRALRRTGNEELTLSDETRRLMEQQELEEWKADEMGRAMKLLRKSTDPNVQEAVRILSRL